MRSKEPLPFAAWEPDKALIGGNASEAKGCIALGGKYVPLASAQSINSGATLTGNAIGAAGFYDAASGVRIFLGDATKLYEVRNRAPTDCSKAGGYSVNPDWAWSFLQFGQVILATGRGLTQVQKFLMGTDTVFSDLTTGPGYSDALFRVREFVFSGVGNVLSNSAFNDHADWVPSTATQAGVNYLPQDGGNIVTGAGGQFGIVFQERKVHRLTYTGGEAPFHRDEIEERRGALGPNAVCKYGDKVFFVSDDGFRATDGTESISIGDGKLDRYFAGRLNYTYRSRVSLACDVEKKILICTYPAGGSSTANEQVIYSLTDGQWTHDDQALHLLFEAPRQGINVDDSAAIVALAGTNLADSINITVDSPVWRETRKLCGAVTNTREVAFFTGANRPATIATGWGEAMPGRKGYVSEIWPLTDAPQCTARVYSRLSTMADAVSEGTAQSMNEAGFCPVEAEGRWISAVVAIPGGTAWTEAVGIDWDAEESGEL